MNSRDLPQEAEPYEKPKVPTQQNELKDRNADQGIPVAGGRPMQMTLCGFAYQHEPPIAIWLLHTHCPTVTTKANKPSPNGLEFLRRIAESMAAKYFGTSLSGTIRRSRKAFTTGRIRKCTINSAAINTGRATSNRTCASISRRNGRADEPTRSCPSRKDSSSNGSQAM